MTPNEYQKLAMRTKSNSFNDRELMLNAALGLAGEASEYLKALSEEDEKEIKKELGDLQWYVALMCDSCSIDFGILMASREMFEIPEGTLFAREVALPSLTGNICDYVKKVYFQGHQLSQRSMFETLSYFQNFILAICSARGFKIEEIWKLNIDKLKKRYPDGFKVQDSVNRME